MSKDNLKYKEKSFERYFQRNLFTCINSLFKYFFKLCKYPLNIHLKNNKFIKALIMKFIIDEYTTHNSVSTIILKG